MGQYDAVPWLRYRDEDRCSRRCRHRRRSNRGRGGFHRTSAEWSAWRWVITSPIRSRLLGLGEDIANHLSGEPFQRCGDRTSGAMKDLNRFSTDLASPRPSLARTRAAGRGPAHGGEAARRTGASNTKGMKEARDFERVA